MTLCKEESRDPMTPSGRYCCSCGTTATNSDNVRSTLPGHAYSINISRKKQFMTMSRACNDFSITMVMVMMTLMLMLSSGVHAATGPPPRFTVEPQSGVYAAHDPVTLTCEVTPSSDVTITWRHDYVTITPQYATQRGMTVNGGTLQIAELTQKPRDQATVGVYNCVANSTVGAVISNDAILEKAVIGHFARQSDIEVNVTQGNIAYIPCHPPASDPPAYTSFEVNTTIIDRSTGRHQLLPSGGLQIEAVRLSDQGVYHCSATNPVTMVTRAAHHRVVLRVIVPTTNTLPRIVRAPQREKSVIAGENLTLECVVEGSPVPVVTWDKYGGILPEGRVTQILGNLVIQNVQATDTGTYICRTENHEGQSTTEYSMVSVLEPPSIRTPLRDQRAVTGSDVTFHCVAPVSPQQEVSWFHNARLLHPAQNTDITTTQLTLRNVQPATHNGLYQCVVRSPLGVANSVAELTVVDQSEESSVVIGDKTMQNVPYEHMQGTDTQTNSGRDGTPPEVPPSNSNPSSNRLEEDREEDGEDSYAYYDDYEEGEEEDYWEGDESYSPRGSSAGSPTVPEDGAGRGSGPGSDPYRATRPNNNNNNRRPSRQRLGTRSGRPMMTPPSRPEVSKLSDTSVMLEWTVPDNDGLEIVFFKVQYKEMNSRRRDWYTVDDEISNDARQHEISGLAPGAYKFRIVAVYTNNDNNHGPNSFRFVLEAEPAARFKKPTTGPVIVEAKPTSVNSIMIRWQYLPVDQSPIEGFFVYYKPYGSTQAHTQDTVIGPNIREHMLASLFPDTEYSIKVRAFNSEGESEDSNRVAKRTLAYTDNIPGKANIPVGGGDYVNPPDQRARPPTEPPPDTMVDPANRHSTENSNQLLYMVLGIVLGVMLLLLIVFMVMCSIKQKQQRRMMASIDARLCQGKYQDPSRTIYNDSSMGPKKPNTMNGAAANSPFLLSGLAAGNGTARSGAAQPTANGGAGATGNPVNIRENPMMNHHQGLDSGDATAECDSDGERRHPPYQAVQEPLMANGTHRSEEPTYANHTGNSPVIDPAQYSLEPSYPSPNSSVTGGHHNPPYTSHNHQLGTGEGRYHAEPVYTEPPEYQVIDIRSQRNHPQNGNNHPHQHYPPGHVPGHNMGGCSDSDVTNSDYNTSGCGTAAAGGGPLSDGLNRSFDGPPHHPAGVQQPAAHIRTAGYPTGSLPRTPRGERSSGDHSSSNSQGSSGPSSKQRRNRRRRAQQQREMQSHAEVSSNDGTMDLPPRLYYPPPPPIGDAPSSQTPPPGVGPQRFSANHNNLHSVHAPTPMHAQHINNAIPHNQIPAYTDYHHQSNPYPISAAAAT